jgi:mannose-6-phosphate isomerase-like protein (cupin superfamily)
MSVSHTASPVRSQVMRLADAQARIPTPSGEHAVTVMQRGTLDVALSIPRRLNPQTPHEQDELYIIIRGSGVLLHDGRRDSFEAGDLLFVAAGIEHQLEVISDDLALYRIFYGPHGGELPGG